MTVRVDFHILQATAPDAALTHACRVAEKAFQAGHRIAVQTADEDSARRFDDLLWSYSDLSFVPHLRMPETPEEWPVTIYAIQCPDAERDYLINLRQDMPEGYERYRVVAEIADQAGIKAARARFRQYRDSGIEPNHHTIKP